MTSCCDSSYSGLPFLCAGMPVRIPEMRLAEPAVTPFAILGGRNHARLIPERNAWADNFVTPERTKISSIFRVSDTRQNSFFDKIPLNLADKPPDPTRALVSGSCLVKCQRSRQTRHKYYWRRVKIARARGRRSRSRHCYEIKWITPEPSTARVTTRPAHACRKDEVKSNIPDD